MAGDLFKLGKKKPSSFFSCEVRFLLSLYFGERRRACVVLITGDEITSSVVSRTEGSLAD